jgi:hypothetical protein
MSAANFTLATLNGSTVTGLKSASIDYRRQESVLGQDGSLHQTSSAVMRTAPVARVTTVAVRALFTLLGTGAETPFLALNGSTGLVLYGGVIKTTGPGYATGANHKSLTAINGIVFLDAVRWSIGQPAEADYSVYIRSTAGGTDPVTSSITATLPTIPNNTEQLALSALTVNSVALTRVMSFDVTFAHRGENNSDECYQNGLPHPVLIAEAGSGGQTEIICNIETTDLLAVIGSGQVVITLTTLNALGVGLASTTAVLTINGVLALDNQIDGDNGGPAKRRIQIRGTWDGSTKPCSITTA